MLRKGGCRPSYRAKSGGNKPRREARKRERREGVDVFPKNPRNRFSFAARSGNLPSVFREIRMRMFRLATAALLLAAGIAGAQAQTAPAPQNPLRPSSTRAATPPAAPQAAPAAQAGEEVKGKRQRSAAQLANDNRMRACGKEWRENKAKLTAQGKTWLTFSTECRARLKAAGQ
jgi:hypothetical protein